MQNIVTFVRGRFQKIYHFGVYFGANLCAKAIPFFLLPIITAYLLPSEYGIWALFIMFVNLLARIFQVGSPQHISRNYYNIDKPQLANHLYNILLQSSVLTVLFTIAAFIINMMPGDTFFSIPKLYLYIIPIMAFIAALIKTVQGLFVFEKKPWPYIAAQLTEPFFARLVAIALLAFFAWGWFALSFGLIISSSLVAIFCFVYLIKNQWVAGPFDWTLSKSMLSVNFPIVLNAVILMIYSATDKLMLESMASTSDIGTANVGLYTLGYSIGMVAMIATEPFYKIWLPWLEKKIKKLSDSDKRQIIRYSYAYFAGIFIFSIFITFIGSLYIKLAFDQSYEAAKTVIFWAALASLPSVIFKTSFFYINHAKKNIALPILTGTTITLNLTFNYILIPINGIVGAAQASILAMTIQGAIMFILAQRTMPMPWISGLLPRK